MCALGQCHLAISVLLTINSSCIVMKSAIKGNLKTRVTGLLRKTLKLMRNKHRFKYEVD